MSLRIHTPQVRGSWQRVGHQMHLIADSGCMEEITLSVGAATWFLYGRSTRIPMATFRSSGWGLRSHALNSFYNDIYIYIYIHIYLSLYIYIHIDRDRAIDSLVTQQLGFQSVSHALFTMALNQSHHI